MNHRIVLCAVLGLAGCDSASTTSSSAAKESATPTASAKPSAASTAGASTTTATATTAATTAAPAEPPAASASATAAANVEEGGTGVGFDSSETLAKAIVDTMNAPTPEKIRALFPNGEIVEKLVTCKEENSLGKEVRREATKMVKSYDKPMKQAPLTFLSSETKSEKTFEKGATHKDCAINDAFAAHKLTIKVKDKDGKEDDETMSVMEYAGKWFLVDP